MVGEISHTPARANEAIAILVLAREDLRLEEGPSGESFLEALNAAVEVDRRDVTAERDQLVLECGACDQQLELRGRAIERGDIERQLMPPVQSLTDVEELRVAHTE
jgi:hypothetical protein